MISFARHPAVRLSVSLALLILFGTIADSTGSAQQATSISGVWLPTGSMTTARGWFTATLLPNGKVLVAGGYDRIFGDILSSAELYDPQTGTWTRTGSMSTGRSLHAATLLPGGKVLVTGGNSTEVATAKAELYDPTTGTWTPTGSMTTPRAAPAMALISNGLLAGKVLVAGGSPECGGCVPVTTAELYDPGRGTWSLTGSMLLERTWASNVMVPMPDGSVFVVGGNTCCPYHWHNEAELFDSTTQTWRQTPSKRTLAQGAAVLMPDGNVLVAGGVTGTQPTHVTVSSAEIFNPVTRIWSPVPSMSTARDGTLTVLRDGQVLATAAGCDGCQAELYDPAAGRWLPTGAVSNGRSYHTATLLPNGQVLVAGGFNSAGQGLSSAEVYIPTSAPGDTNGDGVIDCADISIVRAAFGTRTGQAGFDARADVVTDGVIDIRDLAYVSQKLPAGTVCQ